MLPIDKMEGTKCEGTGKWIQLFYIGETKGKNAVGVNMRCQSAYYYIWRLGKIQTCLDVSSVQIATHPHHTNTGPPECAA